MNAQQSAEVIELRNEFLKIREEFWEKFGKSEFDRYEACADEVKEYDEYLHKMASILDKCDKIKNIRRKLK